MLLRASSQAKIAALITLTVAALFWRRPDQFIHPYVWVEDGYYTLPSTFSTGWRVMFEPLAGYPIFASRLIGYVAFKTAVLWAPQIQLVLVVALICAVLVAVACSPTHLRSPLLCAVAILFLPTESEVYAVSAYAFWWAGILLILALLWDPDRGANWLRYFFIVFGGLSSPLAVTLLPLFILRAAVDRCRTEVIALMFSVAAAIAQFLGMRQQRMSGQFPLYFESISPELVLLGVQQFIGKFFYTGSGALVLGIAVAGALAFLAWSLRAKLDRYFLLLVLVYGALCASVAARQPLAHLTGYDPLTTAPRYFFYPFLLLGWLMIWLAAETPSRVVRVGIAAAFAFSLLLSFRDIPRRHAIIDWPTQLKACAAQDGVYELPIHWDGVEKHMERRKTKGEECRAFLSGSIF